MRFVPF
jgi:hypothetical protein